MKSSQRLFRLLMMAPLRLSPTATTRTCLDGDAQVHFRTFAAWWRESTTFRFEMVYDILNNFAKLSIKSDGIVTMYPSDEVRTLSNVHLIVIAPFHPFVVFIEIFHLLTILIARATCFSW